MKYIEKVILENFQSHKHTLIEFDEGLNVIVGESDSGKTAILRGIKWVLYNEPSGDYFIREGKNECSVTLFFSDMTRIKRYRSRSKNAYYLYNSLGEESIFEGFGTTVPLEIQEATGIKKLSFDRDTSSNINISDQLQGAFLLSEKTSVRAASIGRLVGVNILDDALRDTLKDERNYTINKTSIENTVKNLEEELKEYNYLDDLREKLGKIEILKEKIEDNINLNEKLKNIYRKFTILKEEIVNNEKTIKSLNYTDKLSSLLNIININVSNFNIYSKNLNSLNYIKKEKVELKSMVFSLKNIEKSDDLMRNIEFIIFKNNSLINSKTKLDRVKIESKALNNTLDYLKNINSTDKKIDKLNISICKLDNMLQLRSKLTSLRERKSVGSQYLSKLNFLDYSFLLYDLLNVNIVNIKTLIELNTSYLNALSESEKLKKDVKTGDKEIEVLSNKYKEILLKNEKCPLCFGDIDINKINKIINHSN